MEIVWSWIPLESDIFYGDFKAKLVRNYLVTVDEIDTKIGNENSDSFEEIRKTPMYKKKLLKLQKYDF